MPTMVHIRKASDRGKSKMDWLDSSHTFSFAEYYDPKFIGYGKLRVINEDIVQPEMGFGRHAHRDMEIISYVIEGSLAHKDSIGNGSVIKPGEIQVMSAGTGIEHSEFNPSKTDLLHFLQIWIIPEHSELKPRYEQKTIRRVNNELILIGSQNTTDTAVVIHQDVNLYTAFMTGNHTINYPMDKDRMVWLQLIKGIIKLNGVILSAGDGAAIQDESVIIDCVENAEFLLFDLVAE